MYVVSKTAFLHVWGTLTVLSDHLGCQGTCPEVLEAFPKNLGTYAQEYQTITHTLMNQHELTDPRLILTECVITKDEDRSVDTLYNARLLTLMRHVWTWFGIDT